MKNYFSWKRLGATAAASIRNKNLLLQPVESGLQSASCATRAHLMTGLSGTASDMMVSTISVCTPEQETVDAALLCSFAVPAVGMNYLAYSLNESAGDEDVRVYIAALHCEQGHYRLAPSLGDHTGQQAFLQIVDQRLGIPDADWHYIDIGQHTLSVASCAQHISVNVNKALFMELLFGLSTAGTGQAIECASVTSDLSKEPVSNTSAVEQEPSVLTRFIDQGEEQEEQLDEVQSSLSSIVAMAQELEQRHSLSTQKHLQLEELQNHLLEKERELDGKAKELASRYAAVLDAEGRATDLQERLTLLDERESALKMRTQELTLAYQKLAASRARFSSLIRRFHLAVKLKGIGAAQPNEVAVPQLVG